MLENISSILIVMQRSNTKYDQNSCRESFSSSTRDSFKRYLDNEMKLNFIISILYIAAFENEYHLD